MWYDKYCPPSRKEKSAAAEVDSEVKKQNLGLCSKNMLTTILGTKKSFEAMQAISKILQEA